MPAYSFKERFVPMVADGSKHQTIRAFRKYPVKVGQYAYLYYGMRTKWCKELRDPQIIKQVKCIYIIATGIAIIETPYLSEKERGIVEIFNGDLSHLDYKFHWLDHKQADALAWVDGFRHDADKTTGSFDLMLKFWRLTHDLPFLGNMIVW